MQTSSARGRQLPKHQSERRHAVVHAIQVPFPGFGSGALDGEHLDGTDLRHDNYEESEQVAPNPGLSAVAGPLGFAGKLRHARLITGEGRARSIRWKSAPVEHRFGVRKGRQKCSGAKSVSP